MENDNDRRTIGKMLNMHVVKHQLFGSPVAIALVSACAMAAAVCAGSSHAQPAPLRLGNPEVLSSLGSPLWVKFPITIDPTEPSADIAASRFSLGVRPLNAPVPFVERAEITVERAGDKYALLIRSRASIDEPAVGIVLREALPNGVRSREFFLFLDPAPLVAATATDQNREAVERDLTQPLLQAAQTMTPPKVAESAVPAVAAPVAKDQIAPRKKVRRTRQASTDAAPRSAKSAARSGISPIGEAKPAQKIAAPATTTPAEGGPRLRLSFGEGLSTRAPMNETERAELRTRQFTLDLDDLTSGLLERQHKITQLEKELASLSQRVSAAERLIGSALPAAVATASPVPAVPAAAAPTPIAEARTPVQAAAPVPSKPDKMESAPAATSTLWGWLMGSALFLILLSAAIWGIRKLLNKRAQDYRLTGRRAEDYVAEVMSKQPAKNVVAAATSTSSQGVSAAARTAILHPELADIPESSLAEIHFELPELPPDVPAPVVQPPAAVAPEPRVVTNVVAKPVDDATSRRMRYLQSRYQDIAILMPPIDAPQRLLKQAATVYDEGATDFAKRLLKFAAYSRPYTEEFWLALLELLYREKFVSDYVVNARWFNQYHPESPQWDEIMRIGFLLDPAETLFVLASHWSHEEPATGVWLPSNPEDAKPVSSLPHLKLEFAKQD
jgi:hypothetical protein